MDNLKLPAYPQQTWEEVGLHGGISAAAHSTDSRYPGFTKLEFAALLVAQGYISAGAYKDDEQEGLEIARCAVNVAKAVLEEANK